MPLHSGIASLSSILVNPRRSRLSLAGGSLGRWNNYCSPLILSVKIPEQKLFSIYEPLSYWLFLLHRKPPPTLPQWIRRYFWWSSERVDADDHACVKNCRSLKNHWYSPSPSLSNREKASLNSAICSSVSWSAMVEVSVSELVVVLYGNFWSWLGVARLSLAWRGWNCGSLFRAKWVCPHGLLSQKP